MTQYIWVNKYSKAVLTEETGRGYNGICDSVEEAEEFLKHWKEAYAWNDDDWRHMVLVPIEMDEIVENGDEALENVDEVPTVGETNE